MKETTDKQRIDFILNMLKDEITFKNFMYYYINKYGNDMSTDELLHIKDIIDSAINLRLKKLVDAVQIAQERSLYLSNYLEGNMYTEDADPDACRQAQLMNAKTLFDTVTGVQL